MYKYIISSCESHIGVGTLLDVELSDTMENLMVGDTGDGHSVTDISGNEYYFYDYRLINKGGNNEGT